MKSHTIRPMRQRRVSRNQLSRFITILSPILWENRQVLSCSILPPTSKKKWLIRRISRARRFSFSSARRVASQSLTTESTSILLCRAQLTKLPCKNLQQKRHFLRRRAKAVTPNQSKMLTSIKTLLALEVWLACKSQTKRWLLCPPMDRQTTIKALLFIIEWV